MRPPLCACRCRPSRVSDISISGLRSRLGRWSVADCPVWTSSAWCRPRAPARRPRNGQAWSRRWEKNEKSIKPARPSGLFSLLSVMTNVLVIVLCIAKDQRTYSFVRNLIMARGSAHPCAHPAAARTGTRHAHGHRHAAAGTSGAWYRNLTPQHEIEIGR